MSLVLGSRLGPYDVTALLGEGGMGQVYRATDTNLKRQVAIKVLPVSVAEDAGRLARFQREAEVLAALNHPNIAQIFGLERSGGMTALVMELVEGEDLAQRIARGPIPLDEALPIARQTAEALEVAHEQGIVHRDLKPANIKVRPDGTVKVLDFGLAKAMDPPAPASGEAIQAATITTPAMTQAGMILGTAAYMAPEQAKGKPVDKRADIWAFGCVLYEMLAGRRAFEGEDIAEVLSRVLQREPDLVALPATAPSRVRELIARCLVKDPRQRLRDIGDARTVLDGAFDSQRSDATVSVAAGVASPPGRRFAWAAAAVAAAGLLAPAIWMMGRWSVPVAPEVRAEISTPDTDSLTSFALSDDGSHVVYVAEGERGVPHLWVRALSSTLARPLAGTDGATYPFWSPDGGAVGFFSRQQLQRVDLTTGAVRALAPARNGRGGAWSSEGIILFATNSSPILRVSDSGGDVSPVTTLERQSSHRFPVLLPDGRRFLFWAPGAGDAAGVFLASLDGGAPVRLTASDTAAAYVDTGWLLWSRGGTLLARKLDPDQGTLIGVEVTVADGVVGDELNASGVSTAAGSMVAYRRTLDRRPRQLQWVDRTGTPMGTIGPRDATLAVPRVSPDGRRVAVSRTQAGNEDIWLLDGTRETRFTFAEGQDTFPVWAPDGTRLAFSVNRSGPFVLYQKTTNGAGDEETLDEKGSVTDWSPDGRFLLYRALGPQTQYDLWIRPLAGGGPPTPVIQTPFDERIGRFSPDGRWIAYQSDQSGQEEVYVRPFVAPGSGEAGAAGPVGQWQVSNGGGSDPRWRADGRELFFVGADGSMMAVPIAVRGATLEAGTPVALFPAARLGGANIQYDVTSDGKFLINGIVGDAVSPPIVLVQHWAPEAKP